MLSTYTRLGYTSKRNVALGPFTTQERGETRGRQFGAKTQVGYNFTEGRLVHGSLPGLAWERVKVDGFNEQSGGITALAFSDQTRTSLRSRLGWQMALETELSAIRLRPYLQLIVEHEHQKYARTYRTGFVDSQSALMLPIANRTVTYGTYGTLLAGVSAELRKGMRQGLRTMTRLNQPGAGNSARNTALSLSLMTAF